MPDLDGYPTHLMGAYILCTPWSCGMQVALALFLPRQYSFVLPGFGLAFFLT